jgi:hypothetical protein
MAADDLTVERRPVKGYESLYEVDNLGRLFLLRSGRQSRKRASANGYIILTLKDEHGVRRDEFLHRIVCETFHGPAPSADRSHTNHRNGVKSDNRACNLEWCTRSENMLHSYRELGQKAAASGKFGALNPGSHAIQAVDAAGEVKLQFAALREAQRAGFSAGCISMCISGARPTHKGYRWRLQEASSLRTAAASSA